MDRSKNRKHLHDLASFALDVLKVLEDHEDWNSDTTSAIADLANQRGFAEMSVDGLFCRTERGLAFVDSWYGPASEAPRVGDHVPRDFH